MEERKISEKKELYSKSNGNFEAIEKNKRILIRTSLPPEPEISTEELLEKDELINIPHRFNILFILYTQKSIGFTVLRKLLNLTPGNLDHHLEKLKELGWIQTKTVFSARPLMIIDITQKGRDIFYRNAMKLKNLLEKI